MPGLGHTITIEMGITGDARDWVYAAHVTHGGERIYLGTYCGKLYCVSKEGEVLRTFDIGTTIRAVGEAAGHVWVRSFNAIYAFQDDRLIHHLPLSAEAQVAWGTEGFVVSQGKEVILYTPSGENTARLVFSRAVSLALWKGKSLLVETGNSRFVFSTDAR